MLIQDLTPQSLAKLSRGTAMTMVLALSVPLAAQAPSAGPTGGGSSASTQTGTGTAAPVSGSVNNTPDAVPQGGGTSDADGGADEIVVTGSSIRGVPPTGSNLIQLGSEAVVETGAATTQELLANVPQLSTFNTAPRAGQRSNTVLSTAPDIRGIGQAQTLVLINGHRIVGVGHLQNIPDPSMVPPSAIQRVEVVPDGASSVYGSDGIAGVVNIITRRDYKGLESAFRVGYGDNYRTLNANTVTGTTWNTGGVMVSAEYAKNSRLRAADRDYLTQDFSGVGGADLRAFGNNCTPSTYRINTVNATTGAVAAGGSYFQPSTGAVEPRCTNFQFGDLYPKQERLSFFGSAHQDVTDGIDLFADAFYSRTKANSRRGPFYANGVLTRGVNPYFPAGSVPATVNSITAYFSVNDLVGIGVADDQTLTTYGGTFGANVNLGRFRWTTYLTGSRSATRLFEPGFNSSVLPGLFSSADPNVAIDPFAGRTSLSSRVTLYDFGQRYNSDQYIWEINTKVDGPLFSLPGGDVKVAVGGVHRREFFDGLFTNGRPAFREGVGSAEGLRKVYSVFGELFIPLFGADNATTLVRRLDISLSARYDDYNDFGRTTNPKVGVNWAPFDFITFRGSYGTSFHAPALPDLFGPDTRAGYLAAGTAPPGFTAAAVPGGIFIAGGNPNLNAETATTWSLGADLAPPGIPGLRASTTYYNLNFKGRVAFPSANFYLDAGFRQFIVSNNVCSNGATYNPQAPDTANCAPQPIPAAQVFSIINGLPLQGFPRTINGPADLPAIYSITILRRANLAQIQTEGLDFDFSYRWRMSGAALSASISGNYVIRYDQRGAAGAIVVDQFPLGQQKYRIRGQFGAVTGPLTAVAFINYSGKYKNRYTLITNVPATETIGAFTTVDLHFGYKLPDVGVLSGTELVADIDNLLERDPPFARSGTGYGNGNLLGRVVTVGIRKKF